MKKGYLQVYTGDGKGKTTAAIGLAVRAAGAGLRVYIAQFLKKGDYSEIKALKRFDDFISIEQFGSGRFVKGEPSPEEVAAAGEGLRKVRQALTSGEYDVVVMEEGNVAVSCGLFSLDDLLETAAIRPQTVELIVTGRGADPQIIDMADLVTEMKAVKHYYTKGVAARTGIEK